MPRLELILEASDFDVKTSGLETALSSRLKPGESVAELTERSQIFYDKSAP